MTKTIKRELARRSAIEAVIGHMKTDGRLDRCRLKGTLGDTVNATLAGAGYNLRILLRELASILLRILRRLLADGRSAMELAHPKTASEMAF